MDAVEQPAASKVPKITNAEAARLALARAIGGEQLDWLVFI